MSKIEVFTGSCHLCDEAVAVVTEVLEGSEHEMIVRSIDGTEARAYGLSAVPSVVKDGAVVFTRLPSKEEAMAALR